MLPDRSISVGQKLVKNDKIQMRHFLGDFQTMWRFKESLHTEPKLDFFGYFQKVPNLDFHENCYLMVVGHT